MFYGIYSTDILYESFVAASNHGCVDFFGVVMMFVIFVVSNNENVTQITSKDEQNIKPN